MYEILHFSTFFIVANSTATRVNFRVSGIKDNKRKNSHIEDKDAHRSHSSLQQTQDKRNFTAALHMTNSGK
jgi:hypothetical protein